MLRIIKVKMGGKIERRWVCNHQKVRREEEGRRWGIVRGKTSIRATHTLAQ